MSRVVGDSEEVFQTAKAIKNTLKEMVDLNKDIYTQLKILENTAKDQSYNKAKAIVDKVSRQIYRSLEPCADSCKNLNKYGDFLAKLEQD